MATNGVLPTETEAALVVWINSFPIRDRVKSLGETNDGQVFWEMLREINSRTFIGDLPSRKQSDYARAQNLHFVHKHILSYLDKQGATYQALSDDDVKTFASDGPKSVAVQAGATGLPAAAPRANRATKFLKLILLVVITPPNPDIVNQIPSLPQPTPHVIYSLIQQIAPSQSSSNDEEAHSRNDLTLDRILSEERAGPSSAQQRNSELEIEAQQAILQSKLDRRAREVESLEAEKEDLTAAYQRLQESYEAMENRYIEQEAQLKKLASAHNDTDHMSIRELEAKISHQEEIIFSKEMKISEQQSHEAELQRRISKLNIMADEYQELQDQLHIQEKDLLEQTKKANAGEKYKQKVQISQAIEKDRDSLRLQLEEARPKVKAYEEMRRDNVRLAKENREISSTLSQSEIGNSELRETKQGVVAENARLRRDLKVLREAYAQGQENIADLEDRSNSSDIHSSPTVVDGGLDTELAATSKHEEQLQVVNVLFRWARRLMLDRKSRIIELERANRELVDDAREKAFRAAMLQQRLDSAQELSADQSGKELRMRQDISDMESIVSGVRQGYPIDGSVIPTYGTSDQAHNLGSSQAFKQMREQLKAEQAKRAELERRLSTAHEDVAKASNDQGELACKPKLEKLEESKKQDSVILTQVQSELAALRIRYDRLQQEFDKQWEERNQAWRESHEAILAKAEEETKTATNNHTVHSLTDMILKAARSEPADLNASIERALVPLIQGNRETLAEKQQIINQQNAIIKDLEGRLKQHSTETHTSSSKRANAAEDAKLQTPPSREDKSYTQSLERELKLMSSAYHDLAGRMQMNNIVVQRRAEAPKSWLGKQRKAMEGVGGIVR